MRTICINLSNEKIEDFLEYRIIAKGIYFTKDLY